MTSIPTPFICGVPPPGNDSAQGNSANNPKHICHLAEPVECFWENKFFQKFHDLYLLISFGSQLLLVQSGTEKGSINIKNVTTNKAND